MVIIKHERCLQFGSLYPHAKFQVILLDNFKDMSNFKTCRNAVSLHERHHYLIWILQKSKLLKNEN